MSILREEKKYNYLTTSGGFEVAGEELPLPLLRSAASFAPYLVRQQPPGARGNILHRVRPYRVRRRAGNLCSI